MDDEKGARPELLLSELAVGRVLIRKLSAPFHKLRDKSQAANVEA
jgi:hypothetical protein